MDDTVRNGWAPDENIWFISSPKRVEKNLNKGGLAKNDHEEMVYHISEIADYMLNSAAVNIQNKLVGCCIYFADKKRSRLHRWLRSLLPEKMKGSPPSSQMLISDMFTDCGTINDVQLLAHIDYIYHQLKALDPVVQTLNTLDEATVTDLEGASRDKAGNLSKITLTGTVSEKIAYIENNLFREVPFTLNKAYLGDGLFEMGGFDFPSFDPKKTYTLIRSIEQGKSRAVVMSNDHKVRYKVENIKFIFYLQLLEQLLKVNPELMDAFRICVTGKAAPLKLFFKSRLGIDYSPEKMPLLFQEVFKKHPLKPGQKKIVANALRDRQFGISFMYVPETDTGEPRQETNLSVLHNFKELEAIANEAPQVVSEIGNIVASTDVGKFYLLDKYKGTIR